MKYRPLRNPIMVGKYRLFGDILPFIGFEDIEIDTTTIDKPDDIEMDRYVVSSFFTIQWLNKGFSWGGLRGRTKD